MLMYLNPRELLMYVCAYNKKCDKQIVQFKYHYFYLHTLKTTFIFTLSVKK